MSINESYKLGNRYAINRVLSMIQYKVVELAVVTDESLEEVLNNWTRQGWYFDNIQFAMREASKRPAMAFVIFAQDKGDDD